MRDLKLPSEVLTLIDVSDDCVNQLCCKPCLSLTQKLSLVCGLQDVNFSSPVNIWFMAHLKIGIRSLF